MATFKERALEALWNAEKEELGASKSVIRNCIYLIEAIPDDQHSGEKTCAPNYEAECKRLMEQLKEMTAEKNEAELMVQEAYQEIRDLKSKVDRLEGFREGVILGINARNREKAARELRGCCNRMEDME